MHSEQTDRASLPSKPRNSAALWLLVILAFAACALAMVSYSYFELSLRVAFAQDQIQVFQQMVAKAKSGDQRQAEECLEYVLVYYPSGTKQRSGSQLDWIVEAWRSNAIREADHLWLRRRWVLWPSITTSRQGRPHGSPSRGSHRL